MLTREEAETVELALERLEQDSSVTKTELRLFLQSAMPCGHAVGNLLTCEEPPYGCVVCNTIASQRAEIERLTQEATGLAASQCQDPIMDEWGHVLCRRVLELERQLQILKTDCRQQIERLSAELLAWKHSAENADCLKDDIDRLTKEVAEQCKAKIEFFNSMNDMRKQREELLNKISKLQFKINQMRTDYHAVISMIKGDNNGTNS